MTGPVRLALDTATARVSVAADRPGHAAVEVLRDGSRIHARALLALIEEALRALDAGPADIAVVAVADGPGGFTGLRVGVSAAKALAGPGAESMRLYTAPSLLLRAAAHAATGRAVLAAAPALRREVFAGAWRFGDAGLVELVAPAPFTAEALRRLPPVDLVVGGEEDADLLLAEFAAERGVPRRHALPSARVLLSLLDVPGGARPVDDPAGWEPRYGRPAEAQARWEQAHGRRLPDSTGRAG